MELTDELFTSEELSGMEIERKKVLKIFTDEIQNKIKKKRQNQVNISDLSRMFVNAATGYEKPAEESNKLSSSKVLPALPEKIFEEDKGKDGEVRKRKFPEGGRLKPIQLEVLENYRGRFESEDGGRHLMAEQQPSSFRPMKDEFEPEVLSKMLKDDK